MFITVNDSKMTVSKLEKFQFSSFPQAISLYIKCYIPYTIKHLKGKTSAVFTVFY